MNKNIKVIIIIILAIFIGVIIGYTSYYFFHPETNNTNSLNENNVEDNSGDETTDENDKQELSDDEYKKILDDSIIKMQGLKYLKSTVSSTLEYTLEEQKNTMITATTIEANLIDNITYAKLKTTLNGKVSNAEIYYTSENFEDVSYTNLGKDTWTRSLETFKFDFEKIYDVINNNVSFTAKEDYGRYTYSYLLDAGEYSKNILGTEENIEGLIDIDMIVENGYIVKYTAKYIIPEDMETNFSKLEITSTFSNFNVENNIDIPDEVYD